VNINYRSDIDGLRAIAVLSVIAYHINPNWLTGGFLGVDIFFVISGYLITNIIYKDINNFSFIDFYSRRIKRILPAYYFVALITMFLGYLVYLPNDLMQLYQSAFSSVFFLSNLYFAFKVDYFGTTADQIPLLHTWSLAVEEQFYFIWPALLILLARYSKIKVYIVPLGLLISSFILAELMSKNELLSGYSYYLPFTRAGELLIGSIIALIGCHSFKFKYSQFIGALLVFYSLVFFDHSVVFPGIAGLIPCIGAALLIIGGDSRVINNLLSSRIMVGIGLISFSLYLWHWPILAILRYTQDSNTLSLLQSFCVVFLTFTISFLTWKYVEQPVRRDKDLPFLKTLCKYYLLPSSLVFLAFMYSNQNNGLPQRFGNDNANDFISGNYQGCNAKKSAALNCTIGTKATRKQTTLLIGDSHASDFAVIYDELGKVNDFSLDARHSGSCMPSLGQVSKSRKKGIRQYCNNLRKKFREDFLKYEKLYFAAAWSTYLFDPKNKNDLRASLTTLVTAGKQVILIAEIPRHKRNYTQIMYANRGLLKFPLETNPEVDAINIELSNLADEFEGVRYLNFNKVSKQGVFDSPFISNKPIYLDAGHLSIDGAKHIATKLMKEVDDISILL